MAAMSPLAQLVEDVKAMTDPPLSNREVGRRSGISSSRVHQIVSEPLKALPDPDTLRGLSKGLRLPLRVVVDAALSSVGLPSGQAGVQAEDTVGQMRAIVENSTALSDETRDTWQTLVDGLEARLRREKGQSNGSRSDTG